MENRKKRGIIPVLIRKYASNDLPPKIQSRFRSWYINSESAYEKKMAMQELWEEENRRDEMLTLQELKIVKKQIRKHEESLRIKKYQYFFRAAAILLLPLLGVIAGLYMKEKTVQFIEPKFVEHVVPYGERKQVFLPDGTEVWLNSGSLLIHAEDFVGNIRAVYLTGEANFSVTTDPEKPFIVKTNYMDVEALGTVFNVQSYADAELSVTTLEEGKVRVDPKEGDTTPVILSPNQQVIYNRISKTIVAQSTDAAKLSLWRKGHIVFQNDSFDLMVKALERQFNVRINYTPEKYTGRKYTIKFSPEEDLEEILDVLKDLIHFKYKKEGDTIQLL